MFIFLVGATILSFIWHRYDQNKREQRRSEAFARLRQLVSCVYDELLREAERNCPRIIFKVPSKEVCVFNVYHSITPDTSSSAFHFLVVQALSPFVDAIGKSFTNETTEVDLHGIAVDQKKLGLGSSKFWASEERYRVTANGRNPPDWNERRQIVLDRDRGKCRRCGGALTLDTAHIHHVQRRSDQGDHSLHNLVSLCRSCHTCMEGHGTMRAIRPFYVTSNGTLHTSRCRYAREGTKIWGSVPRLREQGYTPCRKCAPWVLHSQAMDQWIPEVQKIVKDRLPEIAQKVCTL